MFGYAAVIALAIALTSFGAGYALSHKNSQDTIDKLNSSIVLQRNEAETQLQTITARYLEKEAEAKVINENLEQSHAFAISTINNFNDTHINTRLYDPGTRRARSSCTVSKVSVAKNISEPEEDPIGLSTEATGFLWTRAKYADELAAKINVMAGFIDANKEYFKAE